MCYLLTKHTEATNGWRRATTQEKAEVCLGKGIRQATAKIKRKKLQAVPSHSSSCPQAKSPQGKEQLQRAHHLPLSTQIQLGTRDAPHAGAEMQFIDLWTSWKDYSPIISQAAWLEMAQRAHSLRGKKKKEQDWLLQHKYLQRQITNPVVLAAQSRGMTW